MQFSDLYKHRLVLFTGKGGVGKTTLSTAFAMSCAQKGMKTLLMQVNAKDRVGQMFGRGEIGEEIEKIAPNLYCVNPTPASAMREYALMTLKVKIIYRAVFENSIVKTFLNAVPGISEIVLLGKAYFHAAVEEKKGKKTWDIVIIDAPATGHGIFLLKIPSVVTSIITSGSMFDEAVRMQKMLEDPDFTSINIVTLLEDLPINETQMLKQSLEELNIPVDYVFTNKVLEAMFDEKERAILESTSEEEDSILSAFLQSARFRISRVELQNRYASILKEKVRLPRINVPFMFKSVIDEEILKEISENIERQLAEKCSEQMSTHGDLYE